MIRKVLYVAHPVRPTDEEIAAILELHGQHGPASSASPLRVKQATEANVWRAIAWLRWLRRSFPEATFIAPWIAAILSGEDDADPAQREAGLIDACAVIERCDGIVLCGPRISEGMRREMEHGVRLDHRQNRLPEFEVYDLTGDRAYMPSDVELRTYETWSEWAKDLRR